MYIYLALAGAGLIFFVSSLFHGDGDAHDFHHGGDGHDHDSSDGNGDHGTQFRDFLSLRSIALICLGLGLTGAVMGALGIFGFIVPIIGTAFGVLLAYMSIKAIRFMLKQEATTTSSLDDFNGMNGVVSIEIPADGIGQVCVTSFKGEGRYITARSTDGNSIAADQPIEVVEVVNGELKVRKVQSLPESSSEVLSK
ncbi:MAG TPA: NfeD family protein [Parcubacteria group bacterium]|nr:NfeD family protein [Parcubacteria group bacterium]